MYLAFLLPHFIVPAWSSRQILPPPQQLRYEDACGGVCRDLPVDDTDPVCVMFSRYKKGYQFFINQCHARRAICKENLVLHMVHPSRCVKSNQFFKPLA